MFKMKGVIPPLITPFTEDGQLDLEALKKLVEFLGTRVDGLFVTGSYGSCALMTEEERKLVYKTTIDAISGKIPVVAHVGTGDGKSAARLTEYAVKSGAAAVSAVGPFYYKYNDDSICRYYDDILKAAKDCPVYVYNNPQFQGYPMSLSLVKRLKSIGVRGIKDATFDIIMHANYMRLLKDDNFDVALGTEAMWLSASVLGCNAFIPGIGNVFPEICRKMYEQAVMKDYEACRSTQFEVNELRDIMYLARSTQLAVYAMLEIRGIVKCYPRSPFIPATGDEKKAIRNRLVSLGAI
ncbi:MAG: dihydrodipicolinate synthase family protein [Clostridiaceae bacterium]|jgi:dihydrodipicolinate synthase/N-acetylneuraminate lyase|nr:dihydrodipicolinate synthase family protein [Clostridiaceae bacterium]